MRRLRNLFLLVLLFSIATAAAFYFEEYYRTLVRRLFYLYEGERLQFVGKNFHFPSAEFCYGFGVFAVLAAWFLYSRSNKEKLQYAGLGIVLFFLSTCLTTWVDSGRKVIDCTTCPQGIRPLHWNSIQYDVHFLTALAVAIVPLAIIFIKEKISRGRKLRSELAVKKR